MASRAEQSSLICGINDAGGIVYEPYESAAGIEGNLKVKLPESLGRDPDLTQGVIGHMAAELADVDVIAAVGGAISMAQELANKSDLDLIEIESFIHGGIKHFRITDGDGGIVAKKPRVVFLEDVTSTSQTVKRAAHETGLSELVVQGISGFRRGKPAPRGISDKAIQAYNRMYNSRPPYEVPLGFPMSFVIERELPLWIPAKNAISMWLPEVAA